MKSSNEISCQKNDNHFKGICPFFFLGGGGGGAGLDFLAELN